MSISLNISSQSIIETLACMLGLSINFIRNSFASVMPVGFVMNVNNQVSSGLIISQILWYTIKMVNPII